MILSEGYAGSKKQFEQEDRWEDLYIALRQKSILQGRVTGVEKNDLGDCLVVAMGNVKGLIPPEDMGDAPKKLPAMVGSTVAFRVKAVDRSKGVAYLDRKGALEQMASITWKDLEEAAAELEPIHYRIRELNEELANTNDMEKERELKIERSRLWEEAKSRGPVRTCTVRWVVKEGAYADIGGVIAFIPIRELGYGNAEDARDVVSPGESFDVKVYYVDKENGVVRASVRAILGNPYENAKHKYVKGGVYLGKIVRVTAKGYVVEVEPGVELIAPFLPFDRPEVGSEVTVSVGYIGKYNLGGRITRILKRKVG